MKCGAALFPIPMATSWYWILRTDIQWIEFDTKSLKLSLVHDDGIPQDLGIVIEPRMAANIKKGIKVQLALIQDEKITEIKDTTIVIQDY